MFDIHKTMIKSFANKRTAAIFKGLYVKGVAGDLQRRVHVKLLLIEHAIDVGDLRTPPGNKLEKLSGDRRGEYSIRVNRQWRICFKWEDGNAENVEMVDYH